jgi:hypothetical protein
MTSSVCEIAAADDSARDDSAYELAAEGDTHLATSYFIVCKGCSCGGSAVQSLSQGWVTSIVHIMSAVGDQQVL